MVHEAAIHMRLRHESIVSMIGVVFDLDNQGFVLEYVKYGSLKDFIVKIADEDGRCYLPELIKTKLAEEIASGMSYLHTFTRSPIIHGDLKLQNILVGGDFNAKASSYVLNYTIIDDLYSLSRADDTQDTANT
jgi:serine/threonine protein kinase